MAFPGFFYVGDGSPVPKPIEYGFAKEDAKT